ncbi:chromobox protein homolog 3-like [Contarinia nasturtii]|uniref:chromobox protein homolog 3-like n=1 Tax=Contarinia nasturtii TaxID=265458 RepID=UPI0012D4B052|nr:chromobox protein homolog 3-like [Contarinia nasturtii]
MSRKYTVEKILKKRVDKGQKVFYFLKWAGYTRPSWVPAENMFCDDFLREFERPIIKDAKRQGNQIFYLVDIEGKEGEKFASDDLEDHIKIEWLETKIEWVQNDEPDNNHDDDEYEIRICIGNAEQILYVTNANGSLQYWIRFANGNCKFVSAAECRVKFPELVLQYLEENLV